MTRCELFDELVELALFEYNIQHIDEYFDCCIKELKNKISDTSSLHCHIREMLFEKMMVISIINGIIFEDFVTKYLNKEVQK